MGELRFGANLEWTGDRNGRGLLALGDQSVEYSVPASMGGRGAGTNPEELLVGAVGACFSATLASLLAEAKLPAERIRVEAEAVVDDFPGPRARVARIRVSPVFFGVDNPRRQDYEAVSARARERCFIGRHLGPQVSYELGSVIFKP